MSGPGAAAGALDTALPLLACPHCAGPLARTSAAVGCGAGHRFDLARQGYLSLLGGRSRTDTGDDAGMVAARADFLGAGHYAPIADAVASVAAAAGGERVLEIGAGTGYYLAHTDPAVGVALDSSRYAARRAARAHPRVASVLADAWAPLPVGTGAVDIVLVVFAPRVATELARVLRPGGSAIVVTPRPEHLAEIREPLGMLAIDAGKAAALQQRWRPDFEPVTETPVTAQLSLGHDALRALVAMGPAARHRTPEQIETAVATLPERTSVTLAVTVSRLRTPATDPPPA